MKEFIILAEGTAVLAMGKIEGQITQIVIENNAIQYGVSWIVGQDVKTGMFNEHEVQAREPECEKARIGFNGE